MQTKSDHPEAALRALAKHGLRCDMNPTHDMSSLDASEAFWHRYLRMLDANIRQLATNALAAPSPPDSSQGEPVATWIEKFKAHLLLCGLKPCIVEALVSEERAEIAAGDCDCMNEHPEDVAEWEIDEIWGVLKSRDGLHGYGRTTTPPPSSPQVAVAKHAMWISFTDGVVWNVAMARDEVETGADFVRKYEWMDGLEFPGVKDERHAAPQSAPKAAEPVEPQARHWGEAIEAWWDTPRFGRPISNDDALDWIEQRARSLAHAEQAAKGNV